MNFALKFALSVTHLFCASATMRSFWPGQTLSPIEVQKRWGKTPFNKSKFKEASVEERGRMAFDLINRKKDFLGLDTSEIRSQLGDFDGFYFRDSVPTYLIHTAETETDKSWQLVFLIDDHFKVANIIVHKNGAQ